MTIDDYLKEGFSTLLQDKNLFILYKGEIIDKLEFRDITIKKIIDHIENFKNFRDGENN